jgi:hypothetical protein
MKHLIGFGSSIKMNFILYIDCRDFSYRNLTMYYFTIWFSYNEIMFLHDDKKLFSLYLPTNQII